MVIRVAMKGCRRPLVTSVPLTQPRPVPSASAASMARTGFTPAFISIAQTRELTASVEPTERSMPPVRMTAVMPKAMRPLTDACRSSFMKLPIVRKSGLMIASASTTRMSVSSAPYFWMMSLRLLFSSVLFMELPSRR